MKKPITYRFSVKVNNVYKDRHLKLGSTLYPDDQVIAGFITADRIQELSDAYGLKVRLIPSDEYFAIPLFSEYSWDLDRYVKII